jgi:nucleoside-diphosphate-sugar epimerase
MNHDSKIYVAGHRGLVGPALVRRLLALGFKNLVLRTRAERPYLENHLIAPTNGYFRKDWRRMSIEANDSKGRAVTRLKKGKPEAAVFEARAEA